MKIYSENESYKLYEGNMLEMLEVIETNTIDSIVTDPPYELNFMNKGWDNSGIAFQKGTWEKCFEVLKPGGYLLAFGGSRTFHRIACAIEDAGFEIRDTIMWLYGSGFPKSMDISKQIDKKPKANRTIEFKKWLKNKLDNCEKTYKQINEECGFIATSYSKTDFKDNWSTNLPNKEKWQKMKKVIGITETDYDWVCENNIEERGYIEPTGGLAYGSGNTVGCYTGKQLSNNAIDDLAKKYQGWGTALKPSFEPIIVARKPFKGSLVDNVLQNGVGGINIDECRVAFNGDKWKNQKSGISSRAYQSEETTTARGLCEANDNGRFPANTILTYDEIDFEEVCGGFPNSKGNNPKELGNKGYWFQNKRDSKQISRGYDDNGSASRYFYCAKASKKDRDEGCDTLNDGLLRRMRPDKDDNNPTGLNKEGRFAPVIRKNTHPTVKPTELMQYLVRLVTPQNGTILDPFNGSGSTGKAVMYENKERNKNYKYVGIELTKEYLPIAQARIEYAFNQKSEIEKSGQTTIFDFLD